MCNKAIFWDHNTSGGSQELDRISWCLREQQTKSTRFIGTSKFQHDEFCFSQSPPPSFLFLEKDQIGIVWINYAA